MLKIVGAIPLHKAGDLEPGRVASLGAGQTAVVGVETGDGILGLLKVQLEGKRALPAEEFMRGQRDFVGDILGSKGVP